MPDTEYDYTPVVPEEIKLGKFDRRWLQPHVRAAYLTGDLLDEIDMETGPDISSIRARHDHHCRMIAERMMYLFPALRPDPQYKDIASRPEVEDPSLDRAVAIASMEGEDTVASVERWRKRQSEAVERAELGDEE